MHESNQAQLEDTTLKDIARATARRKGYVVRKRRLGDLCHKFGTCLICNDIVGKKHFHFHKGGWYVTRS